MAQQLLVCLESNTRKRASNLPFNGSAFLKAISLGMVLTFVSFTMLPSCLVGNPINMVVRQCRLDSIMSVRDHVGVGSSSLGVEVERVDYYSFLQHHLLWQSSEMVYKNNFYPPLSDVQCRLFETIVMEYGTCVLSDMFELNPAIEFGFDLSDLSRIVLSALSYLEKSCPGCEGNHLCYTVAGGCPSVLVENTLFFNDVDVFVNCTGTLNKDDPDLPETFEVNNNIAEVIIRHMKVQMIQVNFNLNVPKWKRSSPPFLDLFGMYVISTFDLPVCKVALKFVTGDRGTVIDLSGIEADEEEATDIRKMKYNDRSNPDRKFKVPSLCQLAMLKLVNIHQSKSILSISKVNPLD